MNISSSFWSVTVLDRKSPTTWKTVKVHFICNTVLFGIKSWTRICNYFVWTIIKWITAFLRFKRKLLRAIVPTPACPTVAPSCIHVNLSCVFCEEHYWVRANLVGSSWLKKHAEVFSDWEWTMILRWLWKRCGSEKWSSFKYLYGQYTKDCASVIVRSLGSRPRWPSILWLEWDQISGSMKFLPWFSQVHMKRLLKM